MIARARRMKRLVSRDIYTGQHPNQSATYSPLDDKYRAIVLVKIGLRPGDNTDMLEALGLIPTTRKLAPEIPRDDVATCFCGWTSKPTQYANLALATHTRAKHKPVYA